jgi:hypothetical protein
LGYNYTVLEYIGITLKTLVGIPFGGITPAKNYLFLYLALILTPLEEKKNPKKLQTASIGGS